VTRAEIIAEIAELQAQLVILDSVSADAFPFGTIVVFDYGGGNKNYRVKTGEETWKHMSTATERSLAEWILDSKDNSSTYFEVYVMTAATIPFYASA
jgi:hypothetical protein